LKKEVWHFWLLQLLDYLLLLSFSPPSLQCRLSLLLRIFSLSQMLELLERKVDSLQLNFHGPEATLGFPEAFQLATVFRRHVGLLYFGNLESNQRLLLDREQE
jgi:hypothetical protein